MLCTFEYHWAEWQVVSFAMTSFFWFTPMEQRAVNAELQLLNDKGKHCLQKEEARREWLRTWAPLGGEPRQIHLPSQIMDFALEVTLRLVPAMRNFMHLQGDNGEAAVKDGADKTTAALTKA